MAESDVDYRSTAHGDDTQLHCVAGPAPVAVCNAQTQSSRPPSAVLLDRTDSVTQDEVPMTPRSNKRSRDQEAGGADAPAHKCSRVQDSGLASITEEAVPSILERTRFLVDFGQPDHNPRVAEMPPEPCSIEKFFDQLESLMPRQYREEGRRIDGVNIDPKHPTEDLELLRLYLERGTGQAGWKCVRDELIRLGRRDHVVKPQLSVTVLWSQDT